MREIFIDIQVTLKCVSLSQSTKGNIAWDIFHRPCLMIPTFVHVALLYHEGRFSRRKPLLRATFFVNVSDTPAACLGFSYWRGPAVSAPNVNVLSRQLATWRYDEASNRSEAFYIRVGSRQRLEFFSWQKWKSLFLFPRGDFNDRCESSPLR